MTPRQLRDAAVVIAEQHAGTTTGRLQQLLMAIRDGHLALKLNRARSSVRAAVKTEIPAWLPDTVWQRFMEHRRQLGAPLTQIGAMAAISALERLNKSGHRPADVVEQSIERGWRGLFPVKGGPNDRRDRVPVLGRDDIA